MLKDLAPLIVAATGLIAALGALVQNRRGRQEQNRITLAAQRIEEDKNKLNQNEGRLGEIQQAFDIQKRLLDDLEAKMVTRDATIASLHQRNATLEAEIDEARDLRRASEGRVTAACKAMESDYLDIIAVLKRTVLDEAARVAAEMAGEDIETHPHGVSGK